jgi:hypothetical protein
MEAYGSSPERGRRRGRRGGAGGGLVGGARGRHHGGAWGGGPWLKLFCKCLSGRDCAGRVR